MLKINRKFSKGFGILEVLISSAILIVVLGTLMFIAQSSLTNAQYMQERAQAISLAAEGIETVRQIRDSNYIDGSSSSSWNTITGNISTTPIDYSLTYYIPVAFTNNRFRVTTVVPTATRIAGVDYTRTIRFINIAEMTNPQLLTTPTNVSDAGKNGFEVVAEVTWKGAGGKSGKAEIRELITNSRFVY